MTLAKRIAVPVAEFDNCGAICYKKGGNDSCLAMRRVFDGHSNDIICLRRRTDGFGMD